MSKRSIARAYGATAALGLALAGCGREPAIPAPTPTEASSATAATNAPRPAGPERVVLAFGDSLYAGYGLERGQSLPDAIQARLRADGINARVVNAGVSGDTTAAGRQRLAFVLDNLDAKPALVMLGLGGNDVLRQLPVAETRANMAAMVAELRRRGLPVLLTGMRAPPNLGADYVRAFDSIWPDLAKKDDDVLYPFILDGVIGNPALMQPDRVHPNARGVDRIADRVAPLVARELRED